MRSLCGMALAGALAWLAPIACEGVGAPPVSPVQIGLQQGDLPASLPRRGVLGFTTPSEDAEVPGMDMLFEAVDADPLNANGALSAIEGRIP